MFFEFEVLLIEAVDFLHELGIVMHDVARRLLDQQVVVLLLQIIELLVQTLYGLGPFEQGIVILLQQAVQLDLELFAQMTLLIVIKLDLDYSLVEFAFEMAHKIKIY
jgi:hypothetical protein